MAYNAEEVPDFLGPDGPLAALLAPYEDRPYQREMALEVARLLEAGGTLAVEAPTGIGKSLGYGLPAALWARAGNGPVVVSTYTKALQEQLLNTEAPRLRTLVDSDLRVAVLKGRANYACRRRHAAESRAATGRRSREVLAEVGEWLDVTATGDLTELGLTDSRDFQFVTARVASDPDTCASRECTPASGCFYKRARLRAAEADLVVVNHALLSIHLFEGAGAIPAFDALVVDEAHAFLTAALDHLRRTVGPSAVRALLDESPLRGAPPSLREGEGDSRRTALERSLKRLDADTREAFGRTNGSRPAGAETRERFRDPGELARLCPNGFEVVEHALGVVEADVRAAEACVARTGDDDDATAAWTGRAGRFRERVSAMRRDLDVLLRPDPNERDRVYWREWEGDRAFALCHAPLELGPRLVPRLLDGPGRVLFTSATLATGGDFGHFQGETGLGGRLHGLALPSPFDYPEQVRAFAVRSAPDPGSAGWPLRTAETLHALLTDPARNTLALFTSWRDLRGVEEVLSRLAAGAAYSVVAQKPGRSPADLVEEFRSSRPAVLLGTAGFWQGIDLPGDDLEILVVTRLPFGVPTEPRFAARSERLEREGGNPFTDLYLPDAVLRFKQGFGRLIRRRSDRGVLAVLDPRLLGKGYGARFRRALPVEVEPAADGAALAAAAAHWWHTEAHSAAGAGEEPAPAPERSPT